MVTTWNDDNEDEFDTEDELNEETKNEFLSSSVVQKIEKAKLYQMLLTSDFFDDDAADSNVIDSVTAEIRRFVHFKLECLLGDRTADKEFGESSPAPALPWNDGQIQALTILANKVLRSDAKGVKSGGVKKISTTKPAVKTAQPPARKRPNPKKSTKPKTEEELVKEHFEQYKAVDNPEKKPMPSQSQMDQMNAQLANQNAGGAFGSSAGGLGSDLGQLLVKQLT